MMIRRPAYFLDQMARYKRACEHVERIDAINAAKKGSSVEILEKAAGRIPFSWSSRRRPRILMF